MKKSFVTRLIFLFAPVLWILSGCIYIEEWPTTVPESKIVSQSEIYKFSELLFMQPDGSNTQSVTIPENFVKLSSSADGKRIFGLSNPDWMPLYEGIGYPAYWDIENNRFVRCDRDMIHFEHIEDYRNSENPGEVILYNGNNREFVIFDIDSCQEKKKIGEITGHSGSTFISGFSLSPNTQEIVFGEVYDSYDGQRDYRLMKLNLVTGDRTELGKGINPVWSPDGRSIAYLGLDGLCIFDSETNQSRRLLYADYSSSWNDGSQWTDAPQPRWSPDGEWLVFHQCVLKMCTADEALIYKIRVSDGLLVKVHIGGKYPFWRK